MLTAVRRLVRQRAIESVLRQCARDVEVHEIKADLVRDSGGWILELRYQLSASSREHAPLLVDGSGCPLPIETLSCTVATDESQQAMVPRTWMLRLRQGENWDCAVLTCRLRWPTALIEGAVGCLSIPDHVPQVRMLEAPRRVADVTVNTEAVGVAKFGVSHDCNVLGPTLLQAVLAPVEPLSFPITSCAHLLGRLRVEADVREQERVARLVANILEFHTVLFGVPLSARVAIAPAETVPRPAGGALLSIHSIRAFGLHGQEPDDVMLGSRLAGLWWGAGCRISGRNGKELEAALRGAAGILWAESVDSPSRASIIRAWQDNAAASSFKDWWSRAQGGFQHGKHGRWSLRLYHALRVDSRVRNSLRELTHRFWGCCADAEEIVAALGDTAVSLR